MLRPRLLPLAAALLLASSGLTASTFAAERWLHVHVDEAGEDGEKVRVNIPLSIVEKILPAVESDDLKHGTVRIGNEDMGNADLRKMWEAVRTLEDADFITVQGTQNLRVGKQGGFLIVKADGGKHKKGTVNARVPIRVVDALFSGNSNELNIVAAVHALGDYQDGDLVTVEDDDSHVRIWVDSAEQAK